MRRRIPPGICLRFQIGDQRIGALHGCTVRIGRLDGEAQLVVIICRRLVQAVDAGFRPPQGVIGVFGRPAELCAVCLLLVNLGDLPLFIICVDRLFAQPVGIGDKIAVFPVAGRIYVGNHLARRISFCQKIARAVISIAGSEPGGAVLLHLHPCRLVPFIIRLIKSLAAVWPGNAQKVPVRVIAVGIGYGGAAPLHGALIVHPRDLEIAVEGVVYRMPQGIRLLRHPAFAVEGIAVGNPVFIGYGRRAAAIGEGKGLADGVLNPRQLPAASKGKGIIISLRIGDRRELSIRPVREALAIGIVSLNQRIGLVQLVVVAVDIVVNNALRRRSARLGPGYGFHHIHMLVDVSVIRVPGVCARNVIGDLDLFAHGIFNALQIAPAVIGKRQCVAVGVGEGQKLHALGVKVIDDVVLAGDGVFSRHLVIGELHKGSLGGRIGSVGVSREPMEGAVAVLQNHAHFVSAAGVKFPEKAGVEGEVPAISQRRLGGGQAVICPPHHHGEEGVGNHHIRGDICQVAVAYVHIAVSAAGFEAHIAPIVLQAQALLQFILVHNRGPRLARWQAFPNMAAKRLAGRHLVIESLSII